jgi:putative transposase
LTFMMLDDDVVAVSPASVYRVLKQANRLDYRRFSLSRKVFWFSVNEMCGLAR